MVIREEAESPSIGCSPTPTVKSDTLVPTQSIPYSLQQGSSGSTEAGTLLFLLLVVGTGCAGGVDYYDYYYYHEPAQYC